MRTLKHLITKVLVRTAEKSMHSPSRMGNYQEDMRKLKKKNHTSYSKALLGCALVTITLFGFTEHVNAYSEPGAEINARMALYKYKYVRNQQGEIMYTYDQVYTWVADDAYIVSYTDRVIDYSGANTIYERTYNYSSGEVYLTEPTE